tara:strand:- start:340 stop:942 length:603 start_codon:yes stop_codon:yes gene_type:complete
MTQIYKVFSNNWVFYLKEDFSQGYNWDSFTIVSNMNSFIELMRLSVLNKIPNKVYKNKIIFFSQEIKNDWLRIINSFSFIEAAGGLVRRSNKELLFILKNGKWDLPKGKIDFGENPEQAAIREVKEETGLLYLEVINFISETYHLYNDKCIILKKTFWFLMKTNDFAELIPQKEEGITDLKWFPENKTPKTYNSINDVIK